MKENKAKILGSIGEEFSLKTRLNGVGIYQTTIQVKRYSGTIDFVPLIISEGTDGFDSLQSWKGKKVKVTGELRSSYIRGEDGKDHSRLFVHAQTIRVVSDEATDKNLILLSGILIDEPICKRKKSYVTELLIKAENTEGRKVFARCITWQAYALQAAEMHKGDVVSIRGRFQSRDYTTLNLVNGRTWEVAITEILDD